MSTTPPPQPAGWGQPQPTYPPPGYAPVQQSRGTNGLAIASMVLGILWIWGLGALLALIFGLISRKQIRESGQGGNGMAVAGIVLGIVGLAGAILITILVIVAAAHTNNTNCYTDTAGNLVCN